MPVQLVEMLKILVSKLSNVWFEVLLAILSLQDVMCNVKTSTKNVKAVKNIGKVRIIMTCLCSGPRNRLNALSVFISPAKRY